MDSIETELDMMVAKAEREVDAARQRRDAYRQRVMQKQRDAEYLIHLADWLLRPVATLESADGTDSNRLREIAARLSAIVLQE